MPLRLYLDCDLVHDNLIVKRIRRIEDMMNTGQDTENISKPILQRTVEETHSKDGVDLSLIRWMLSLSPIERLHVLQRYIQSVEQLRDAEVSA